MRTSTLAFGFALALSGSVLAQNPDVRAGASSESSTSVSASRNGAAARHEGGASAAAQSQHADANVARGGEMNAALTSPVDSRRAKPGDEVTAILAQDAQAGGQVMHRGTKLVGHVTEAQPRGRRSDSPGASGGGSGESRLGIVFDKAIVEGGREVPVNATIQAIAASEAGASGNARGIESTAGGSALGAGRASGGGPLGGGGIVGGVTGTAGAALGGANVGGGLGAATSSVGSASRASAGAVGGLSAAGRLMSGSRGVFGLGGIDIVSTAAGGAQGSSVLTSRTGNIGLDRGTQLLLAGQAAGGAQGAVGGAAGGASAVGGAAGSVAGASATRPE